MVGKSVSVIIPAYNEEKDIKECLETLNNQSLKDIEIIVVDDGSTDRTREIIRGFNNVKLIEGQHKGPGFSRNLGAKHAKGKILVFVDADMSFNRSYIESLINPLVQDRTGKIIGTVHDYEIAKNMNNVYSRLWGVTKVDYRNVDKLVNGSGFRSILKKKFIELGGFDPRYGYADDLTFWFKYHLTPVIAHGGICYHKNPETLKDTYKQARWIGASWRERFLIFRMPVLNYVFSIGFVATFPLLALVKAAQNHKYGFSNSLKFYFHKFRGYSSGVIKAVWLKRYAK